MTPNDIQTGHVGWSPDYDSSKDPNNLEGPPRTPEELAENFRELDKVAPTPAEKLMLMTGNLRPTPRTDAAANDSIVKVYETSKQLERELAEMTEQRDALLAQVRKTRERVKYYEPKIVIMEEIDQTLAKLNPRSASTSPSKGDGAPPPPCPG